MTQLGAITTTTDMLTTADIGNIPKLRINGTVKPNAFPAATSATTTSGVATLYFTTTGDSSGTALFNTFYPETLTWFINDHTNQYSVGGYTVSGDKKTVTVNFTRLTTSNTNVLVNLLGALTSVLTGINNTAVPNGTTIRVSIWGEP